MNMEHKVSGIQLTGRHAWPDELTGAARVYAREPNEKNLEALKAGQRDAARKLAALQVKLGFSYVYEGGFGLKDDFVPYIEKVGGIGGGKGQINQQPGTRNQYYFIPFINGKLHSDGRIFSDYLLTGELPEGRKKKVTLISPLSFALASESTQYSGLVDLLYDFSEIQRREIEQLSKSYDYIQLNESFASDERFSKKLTKDLLVAFGDRLDRSFKGLGVRSAVFCFAGDAKSIAPVVIDSKITDIGFDFNTSYAKIEVDIDKNLILGQQNVTRKLPDDLLADEPGRLAAKAKEALASIHLRDGAEVFLGQSQGSDGLQTYPQAIKRDENLSAALRLLRGEHP